MCYSRTIMSTRMRILCAVGRVCFWEARETERTLQSPVLGSYSLVLDLGLVLVAVGLTSVKFFACSLRVFASVFVICVVGDYELPYLCGWAP